MTVYNETGSFSEIQQEINEWTIPSVSMGQVEPMEAVKINVGFAVEQHQWTNYQAL
ncbi:MAG TPA: hypothetical protein VE439_10995 [Anaerolineae bacterium]|nr:hypothetical protein [Anaerolineae bacterium]